MTKAGKKKCITIFICILFLWIILISIDFKRTVYDFKKPIFALRINPLKDGGSGAYAGLGYTIYIEGKFEPTDDVQGVTYAKFKLFGLVQLKSVHRQLD